MANIALLYGSAYGQTERITRRIAETLTSIGHTAHLWRGDRIPHDFSLDHYDGSVIAASVLFGKHQRYIRDFVRAHARKLDAMPSAFVSVSGSAASPQPEAQAEAQRYIDELLAKTAWHPMATKSVAGEVAYRKYNPLLRWVMKRISARVGRPTDTSRDYDFTDWPGVDGFARELGERFHEAHGHAVSER